MILALAGGVGGAKLAHGLQQALGAGLLTVVNTGDDFDHLGLRICPDLDTVVYTLAGRESPATGWGLAGETWRFLAALERLGGATWFRLGDQDLATHVHRTRRLAEGARLSEVTAELAARLGAPSAIAPMTDDAVRTVVLTDAGTLSFQEYFVERRCEPRVRAVRYAGAQAAAPSPALDRALDDERLELVVICPSNPYLSVAPILNLPGIRERLRAHRAPVVAVSPIVGGDALKGPAAKMMREFGVTPSAAAVAAWYGDLLDGFVVDTRDEAARAEVARAAPGTAVEVSDTVMREPRARRALAEAVVAFGRRLAA